MWYITNSNNKEHWEMECYLSFKFKSNATQENKAAQKATGLLCCWDAFLAHGLLVSTRHPGPFLQAAFQAVSTHQTSVQLVLPRGRALHLPFPNFTRFKLSLWPFPCPVHVSLHGSTTTWLTCRSSQFCNFCKFVEGVLCPIIQVINKAVKYQV